MMKCSQFEKVCTITMFAKGEDERFYEIVNMSDLVFERTLSTQSVIEFENFVGRTYHKFVFSCLYFHFSR